MPINSGNYGWPQSTGAPYLYGYQGYAAGGGTLLPGYGKDPAKKYIGNVPSMGDVYSSAMESLRGYGTSAQEDLRQNYLNALGMGTQALVQSGLAGTSAMPSMRMGYFRQYQRALNDLNQRVMQTKSGLQAELGSRAAQMGLASSQFQQNLALGYAGLAARNRGGGGGYGGGTIGGGDWNRSVLQGPSWRGGGGGGGYEPERAVYYPITESFTNAPIDPYTDPYYGQSWNDEEYDYFG